MKTDWTFFHPRMTLYHLGFIPSFLSDDDPRPASEQIRVAYIGGWMPFHGFKMNPKTGVLKYKGDSPIKPLASTVLRDERIVYYPHDWLAIIQLDGSFEIAHLD